MCRWIIEMLTYNLNLCFKTPWNIQPITSACKSPIPRSDHCPACRPAVGRSIAARRSCLYRVESKLNISILKCYTGNTRARSGQISANNTREENKHEAILSRCVCVHRGEDAFFFFVRNYKIIYGSVLVLVFKSWVSFLHFRRDRWRWTDKTFQFMKRDVFECWFTSINSNNLTNSYAILASEALKVIQIWEIKFFLL